ncbi:MAG: CobW family GTP-binding protein [Spirulinaceae cyanobacterium]
MTISDLPDIPKQGMPVTIITGFLGSGKTTLLNQILQQNQDLKIAVLVNEFGDINIDAQLLISVEEDMLELSNGCICCTINDGLIEAVYRILERPEKVDHLIVETTGIADPLPIILTFLGPEFRDLTCLDSIIAMVDSETFTPEHFDSEAALKQVAFSDVVVLNKTDLASPQKVNELEAYIKTLKVGARILRSNYGQVPLPLILDVGLTPTADYLSQVDESNSGHHHHHHHHSHHLENDGFMSISFQKDRPFSVDKFEHFLTEEMPQNVFRAKGILWFKDRPEDRYIFQLSGARYDMQYEPWQTQPHNQVVFIGRHLDATEIRQKLEQCLVISAKIS